MDIKRSTALVTGGNRGFGNSLVAELARHAEPPCTPPPVIPRRSKLEGAIPIQLDITDAASVAAAADGHAAT